MDAAHKREESVSDQRAHSLQHIRSVVDEFPVYGELTDVAPYGNGHIHDTYAVTVDQGRAAVRYILQRINHNVFKDVPAVQHNIARVTEHIRRRLRADGADEVSGRVLRFLPASCGRNYHTDDQGNFWRLCFLIEGTLSHDQLETTILAREVARSFGQFQLMLADLAATDLHETIPNFHNGPVRFAAFQAALEADAVNRAAGAKAEIDFLLEQSWIFDVLPAKVAAGEIPVRITHNDTKVNNVLVDEHSGEGFCIIDLDTVMPGLALYDFGDMVRTGTNTGAEDEVDLGKVSMDIHLFQALVEGYLKTAGGFLNKAEREHLAFSGKMLTLMIGTRFLTDYLNGDTYFRIHRPSHNLDRCRTQFKLVQSITEQEEAMNAIVARQ
jgi:aminoglycoside phosphotransferase (APT) family kinase protein